MRNVRQSIFPLPFFLLTERARETNTNLAARGPGGGPPVLTLWNSGKSNVGHAHLVRGFAKKVRRTAK